jgi:hypothetical protein
MEKKSFLAVLSQGIFGGTTLLIFGSAQRPVANHLGSWLAIPSGVLLRLLNIFGLLIAVVVSLMWLTARLTDWTEFPPRELLPLILFALYYFDIGTYLSIKSLQPVRLLSAVIALNVPLLILVLIAKMTNYQDLNLFAYSVFGIIGLWTLYSLGRVISARTMTPVFFDIAKSEKQARIDFGARL